MLLKLKTLHYVMVTIKFITEVININIQSHVRNQSV